MENNSNDFYNVFGNEVSIEDYAAQNAGNLHGAIVSDLRDIYGNEMSESEIEAQAAHLERIIKLETRGY